MQTVYIKKNSEFAEVETFFKKNNSQWGQITKEEFATYITSAQTVSIFNDSTSTTRLEIAAPRTLTAETCQCNVTVNGIQLESGYQLSVVSGTTFATIDNTGLLTVLPSANKSNITLFAEYGEFSATRNMNVTYKSGSTSETTSQVVVDQSGNTIETTTTVTENEDGTSSSESTVIVYNENGEPTEKTNETVDTGGNVNTQEIEYNENGEEVVVGYEIDTTNNPDGKKTYNGDGVDTEYYAFDTTDGFELRMHFTIDFSGQPSGQDENHHQILSAKRTTPEPWYGFQLRQSGNNKYVQLGTQFNTGGNQITQVTGNLISGNTYEYDLKITYNPLANVDTFVCKNMLNGNNIYISDGLFPDIEELKNLRITIGYAVDGNGNPYRYSNIDVINFSISKLSMIVRNPVIHCTGEEVQISCETSGATIYYKLNQTGNYETYSSAIPITADTIVEAYAELNGKTSETVLQNCIYDDGIEEPVIYCDGEEVTINCETPSADIYYKLNHEGNFTIYESAIQISATTIVDAFSYLDGKSSNTVTETCVYDASLKVPVISCEENEIEITCETHGADIYYRVNEEGNFSEYVSSFMISADTLVEAYSSRSGETSTTVSANCIYDPTHHYENDYLTFVIISGGTIAWTAFGSGYKKSIEYSINNGPWISISATTSASPTTFSVAANDVVRFRGTNSTYAGSKANYDGFEGGTAIFNIEGNIMSLVYGDNFVNNTAMTGTYNFCSIFKKSKVVSAENLILPSTVLTNYCYRAMFSFCTLLEVAPKLPSTTLAQGCYWYMFEYCAITEAPELATETLVRECYGHMFENCSNLNYIKCNATNISAASGTTDWVKGVSATGTFVKNSSMTSWTRGTKGIPNGWTVCDDVPLFSPVISYDCEEVEITCQTSGATIYYNLNQNRSYNVYTGPIQLSADTTVDAYSEYGGQSSVVVTQSCHYANETPFEYSNKNLGTWTYNNQEIETPYSVNAIDGHSSSYAKGNFVFETTINLRSAQPTYLWFQHADQSADIYVDNVKVTTHWGGYNAFFTDISNYVHRGTNYIKVILCNTTRNTLAPAAGDFNFNATLGNVKLFTSPVLPDMEYGYDGFHVTADVTDSSATVTVKTKIPVGAEVVCTISDSSYTYTDRQNSTSDEMSFSATIQNPHLWNGTLDPHLYMITMDVYYNGDLYHRYQRPYGLRYYRYVINETINGSPYTGFLLNGSPYLLRGVCMHDDVDGRANALTSGDVLTEFNVITELGCNFLRLAHYPHPKEVYAYCDQLGIIVQTEVPCVNKLQSTMPEDYYTHLEGQYRDMVNQHYNHPCIMFWGLSNETTTDDKDFGKTKIEQYTSLIKSLDSERLVGYVMSHSYANPSSYYNNPNVDWFGCNIYVGWYIDKASNDPTSQLNTRVKNIITTTNKALAFSEYGCGGTQHCHSEDPQNTTTKGNYERHDIEYMMWLHEGHIAAIRNFPQLLFTAEWQLFDIAVSNRNEGYTACLDGENTSIDNNLRRLNDKGLVERDHVTKKDSFYIYKAEWGAQRFVHICGKDYTRKTDRVIKCYTNDGSSLSMYVNSTFVESAATADHITLFTSRNFSSGDVIQVSGATTSDTFTFE